MPTYTMKPGAKKAIQIKIKELLKLRTLYLESEHLTALGYRLDPIQSKSLIADAAAFRKKVLARLKELNGEIKAMKAENQSRRTAALAPLIKRISTECSGYVSAFRAARGALYRGAKDHGTAFVGRSWTGRSTLDSPELAQTLYDLALDRMGIAAKSGNSIFATGKPWKASEYGTVYVIFPKDSAVFSWATKPAGYDITLDTHSLVNMKFLNALGKSVKKYLKDQGRDSDNIDIYSYLDRVDGIGDLIKSLKRIGFPNTNKITDDNIIDLAAINKQYGPTDQDLAKAIRKGHEVLISGEYYAVKFNSTGAALLDALGIKHPLQSEED